VTVDSCYYDKHNINLSTIDSLYLYYFIMYTIVVNKPVSRFNNEYTTTINAITNETKQKRNFISPFNFSQYVSKIEKDLHFRHLTIKELPQFYNALYMFKNEVDNKEIN